MQTCIDPPSKQPAGVVAGSPEEVAEQLLSFIGLGFTAMNFSPTGPGTDEQIERLAPRGASDGPRRIARVPAGRSLRPLEAF